MIRPEIYGSLLCSRYVKFWLQKVIRSILQSSRTWSHTTAKTQFSYDSALVNFILDSKGACFHAPVFSRCAKCSTTLLVSVLSYSMFCENGFTILNCILVHLRISVFDVRDARHLSFPPKYQAPVKIRILPYRINRSASTSSIALQILLFHQQPRQNPPRLSFLQCIGLAFLLRNLLDT